MPLQFRVASSASVDGAHVVTKSSTLLVQISTLSTAGSKLGTRLANSFGTHCLFRPQMLHSCWPSPQGSRQVTKLDTTWMSLGAIGASAPLPITKDMVGRCHNKVRSLISYWMVSLSLTSSWMFQQMICPGALHLTRPQPFLQWLQANDPTRQQAQPGPFPFRLQCAHGRSWIAFWYISNRQHFVNIYIYTYIHTYLYICIIKTYYIYICVYAYSFLYYMHTHDVTIDFAWASIAQI